MSLITLFALFGDDIRVIATSKNSDAGFYIVTIICMTIFMLEILLSCYSKKDYLFNFFFWLDFVSTITMLLDIGWFSDMLFPTNSDSTATSANAAQLAKAAAASRIGTRAARVIRIIRLIRLIRVVKLYKASQKHNEASENDKDTQMNVGFIV